MIHVRHYHTDMLSTRQDIIYSERVAYQHSYNVYMNAGQVQYASQLRENAINLGFWGLYPVRYNVTF